MLIGLEDRSILRLTKERLKAKEDVPDEKTFLKLKEYLKSGIKPEAIFSNHEL